MLKPLVKSISKERKDREVKYIIPQSVYRLVLEAFIGPCPEGKQAAHLDGNVKNSQLPNLAWVTPSENCGHKKIHGTLLLGTQLHNAKLNPELVRHIRRSHSAGASMNSLAKELHVSDSIISDVIRGRRWGHVE